MVGVRRERDALADRAEVEIDRLHRPLMRAVAASVRKHGGAQGGMTPLARALIIRDVDVELSKVYGIYRGDADAPLYRLVVSQAREAWRLSFARSVALLRARLRGQAQVLRMVEGGR